MFKLPTREPPFTTSRFVCVYSRVVIRVPQKTKYIHHHTIKKVPIYVLVPEKKPKILEALEEAKPSVRPPCKDLYELPTVREDTSTQTRNRYEKTEREKPLLSEWTEDSQNRGAYYVNAVDTSYRTIDEDFLLPPPMSLDDLPFRRVNADIDPNPFEMRQPRGHEEHHQQSVTDLVTFTYPPPTPIQNQEYTSYQYRINH